MLCAGFLWCTLSPRSPSSGLVHCTSCCINTWYTAHSIKEENNPSAGLEMGSWGSKRLTRTSDIVTEIFGSCCQNSYLFCPSPVYLGIESIRHLLKQLQLYLSVQCSEWNFFLYVIYRTWKLKHWSNFCATLFFISHFMDMWLLCANYFFLSKHSSV